jgi:hypothetical protein
LSNRKKFLSCMFPAEIFSSTPCISISVHVSVMLEPWQEQTETGRRKQNLETDQTVDLKHTSLA